MEIKPVKKPQNQDELNALCEELGHMRAAVKKMKEGPLSVGYFCKQESPTTAIVITEKGDTGQAVLLDQGMDLKRGDTIFMITGAMSGAAVTSAYRERSISGDIARFERRIGDDRAEIIHRNESRIVWTTHELHEKIMAGKVKTGARLVIKDGPGIAFDAIDEETNKAFRYLFTDPIPDIDIDRDIGAPHECLEKVLTFIRRELKDPGLHRKYNIRPLYMLLMEGVSGSGKTLSVLAIIKKFYQLLAEHTGMDESALPNRVLRMKSSQMLSMWLGESDKNFERFMDEAEEISKTPVKVGRKEFVLPILIYMEEIDGIASQRGSDGCNGQVHDRILTTLLQRMDPTVIGDRPIISIATTNEPGSVDRAFLRRVGGEIAHFGMLCNKSFPAVLDKHLRKLPVQDGTGKSQNTLKKELVGQLTELFYERKQPHVVDIHLQGAGQLQKYRRDFMTAAMVDRAVQQAAKKAVTLEEQGKADGVSFEVLAEAFVVQTNSIISQLNESNAHRYLDLPHGERVVKVKKVSAVKEVEVA